VTHNLFSMVAIALLASCGAYVVIRYGHFTVHPLRHPSMQACHPSMHFHRAKPHLHRRHFHRADVFPLGPSLESSMDIPASIKALGHGIPSRPSMDSIRPNFPTLSTQKPHDRHSILGAALRPCAAAPEAADAARRCHRRFRRCWCVQTQVQRRGGHCIDAFMAAHRQGARFQHHVVMHNASWGVRPALHPDLHTTAWSTRGCFTMAEPAAEHHACSARAQREVLRL
jgi:hypothetical protein